MIVNSLIKLLGLIAFKEFVKCLDLMMETEVTKGVEQKQVQKKIKKQAD